MEELGQDIVFISYAREDSSTAERLYMDLRRHEINAWIDTKSLLPGENWHKTVGKVIKSASFFVLLISKNSVSKRGFVQREIKQALKVLEEFPTDQIFLIPVKLDHTEPIDEELQALNWVDLGGSYRKGLRSILAVFQNVKRAPLVYGYADEQVGRKTPIEYSPYKDTDDFFRHFSEKLPVSTEFTDTDFEYYITYLTGDKSKVELPQYLRDKYPERITIVLQHQYKDLRTYNNSFTVKLNFGGVQEALSISYSEILSINIPQLGVSVENKKAQQRIRG